ncbi:ATP-binding protein [Bacillus sp. FJAT-50079]|uniref:ATP-binding protein n=1 Tax=Bacillus sp. FJAT-50079 TaxID=2833577 RepID=UPI001BC9EC80|nr:ATP-binding protein [Bacillus sp. FJAT-50079]MBS4209716.1 HAMP domain-containing protein [Bacillus sp. FJAT-50079]
MRLWRSVVGKLWMTILALVSFVLIILTMLLLQFFETYHVNQIEQGLSEQARKISAIIEAHADDNMGEKIVFEIVDDPVGVAIAYNEETFLYSPTSETEGWIPKSVFLDDQELSKVFSDKVQVRKELSLAGKEERGSRYDNFIVAGVPIQIAGDNGAIYVYQSLAALKDTTQKTTRLILLAAGIAIVLTTIFAFFLSTRITAPLRKMKEAVLEISKGKFDTKIPFLSHDEIGELAIAFNQMGKRLNFNMNVLSQEKEQLTSILSSMADGVMTFSQNGSILITNPPAERFLQQWHYVGEQDSPIPTELDELLSQAIKTEMEQIGELQLQGRYYVVIVSPLYTQNQESVRGAVAVVRDMTEERRLDKLRIDFISNVSHELRTPIAMLQGYSEAIIDDIAGSEEENKELAKIIYDESLRIGRLVNELLDLARMESGHISLNYEDVDIEKFIERIIYKFKGMASENDVALHSSIALKGQTWRMDPDRIEQVLTNLIDNAIRHTKDKGSITISQTEHAKGIAISVQDDGTGIPEEDLPFVFERFYKADKARTRGGAGTGLGLAIAKNIIDAHLGTITVQSKQGQGTTFTFFLPYSPSES